MFGLNKLTLGTILNWFAPADLLSIMLGKFGLTDVIGMLVHYLGDVYAKTGRYGVVAAATIKTASLQSWATSAWSAVGLPDGPDKSAFVSNVIAKFGALANALADAVGSLIPPATQGTGAAIPTTDHTA